MAHFEKYKKGDAKRVMREAFRECESKSEFYDPSKSKENRVLWQSPKEIDELTKLYKPRRKDSVILINEIMTRPKGLREQDEDKFYTLVAKYTAQKLNVSPAYLVVHNDEKTQHAHIAYFALDNDTGKWNGSTKMNRTFFLNYHRDLENFVASQLGYLVEIRKDNKEPHLSFDEYKEKMKQEDQEREQESQEREEEYCPLFEL